MVKEQYREFPIIFIQIPQILTLSHLLFFLFPSLFLMRSSCLYCWGNIITNKIFFQPRKPLHKGVRERKLYYWISINPKCDALYRQSAKRLPRGGKKITLMYNLADTIHLQPGMRDSPKLGSYPPTENWKLGTIFLGDHIIKRWFLGLKANKRLI